MKDKALDPAYFSTGAAEGTAGYGRRSGSPCYFGLCGHKEDVARSQIRCVCVFVCVCVCVLGATAHACAPPYPLVLSVSQQSTPQPLCGCPVITKRGRACARCVCLWLGCNVWICALTLCTCAHYLDKTIQSRKKHNAHRNPWVLLLCNIYLRWAKNEVLWSWYSCTT